MTFLPALLLAAAVDGEAALGHASALAALGPHPWGSPRGRAAAEYVAAQFRDAGLQEVRLQQFESKGVRGINVLGVLRAPGSEFVLVGAHHDSAPDAPGAYDDGGGVGVLVEVARVLAQERSRPRTLVFASFDGEEAWSTRLTTTAGSRHYIASQGPEARQLVAAFVVEMCGWKGGTPVFHPIAYDDPMRPGASVITPGWLLQAASAGARDAGAPIGVGDPYISWIYQPAVRTFRIGLYGDDLSFLQAGHPALFASDSSFSAYYPWYHEPTDTKDKLDAAALARMGQGVLGVVRALGNVKPGPRAEPQWFAAFGQVFGASVLLAVGALSLVPGLLRGLASGGLGLGARLAFSILFALLLWRQPVPALWIFLLPNLLVVVRGGWARVVSLVPALLLLGLGLAAARRGYASGLWLAPWEVALFGLAVLLAVIVPAAPVRSSRSLPRKAPRPGPRR
jgi:hypothetical protein